MSATGGRLTRRALVAGGVLVAVAAASASWLKLRPSVDELLVRMVRKHVRSRPLDEAGLRRFAADYKREHLGNAEQHRSWQALRLLGPSYELLSLPDIDGTLGRLHDLERHVVSAYLLASSYFTAQDTSAPVQYVALVNKKSVCRNPFARFD
jgi:hypothetical protein